MKSAIQLFPDWDEMSTHQFRHDAHFVLSMYVRRISAGWNEKSVSQKEATNDTCMERIELRKTKSHSRRWRKRIKKITEHSASILVSEWGSGRGPRSVIN